MLFRTYFVSRNKFLTKCLYQYLWAIIYKIKDNNAVLAAHRLPLINLIFTLKKILPTLAKIPASFGNLVKII